MAPNSQIFLTRHAEGYHNVEQDWSRGLHEPLKIHSQASEANQNTVYDPALTPKGKDQATSAAPHISDLQQSADLIVTSALRRTLQTTLRTWAPAIERLGRENVICLPEAQECMDLPCDCGSSRAELEADPEFAGLDFSRLTPDWNTKTGFYASDRRSLVNRVKWVRHFLRDRPEEKIVLVVHGDFLREITCTASGPTRHWWDHVEIQVWEFDSATVDKDECFLKFVRKVDTRGTGKGAQSSSM